MLVLQWIRRERAGGVAMKNKANLEGRRREGTGSRRGRIVEDKARLRGSVKFEV